MIFFKKTLYWLLTFFLVFLCLVAAKWQYDKGILKSNRNSNITKSINLIPLSNPQKVNPIKDQWRSFLLDGEFERTFKLLKNQYQDGQYGFHVLQKFTSQTLGEILVDRGWVKAGQNASTLPVVPVVNMTKEQIKVRLRSESLQQNLSGTLFASASNKQPEIIYYDLLASEYNPPLSPLELPTLSVGPHFAYAFQWIFFAVLILVGRIIFGRRIKQ